MVLMIVVRTVRDVRGGDDGRSNVRERPATVVRLETCARAGKMEHLLRVMVSGWKRRTREETPGHARGDHAQGEYEDAVDRHRTEGVRKRARAKCVWCEPCRSCVCGSALAEWVEVEDNSLHIPTIQLARQH